MKRNQWTPWDTDTPTGGTETESVRVYCLPHAGGSAGSYLAWSRSHEVPGLRFVPVELPGRGTRLGEPLPTSMDEVVDGFLTVLADRPEHERFLLLGHSMGAQIAYETTRRLAVSGRPLPRAVVVSGCRPPGAPVALPLHDRSDDELLEGIVELGGTPAEVLAERELLGMLLPVMRADLGLLARYTTDVRPTVLPCPVLALGGADDQLAGPEWITGWQAVTAENFRHRILPGDHFFLHARAAEAMAEIAAAAREHAAPAGG
ncbi:thioesterase II family protein [Actinacidiphila yeochonensis]|uniref:thioesterase II family protein n=1 Tax=Actinacidiphila yeochonensis TaxID=89050 RepID=UPI0006923AB2|nr:alpha/beta fold hydrolase [Actinacidiphila yeochonensis]